MKSLLFLILAYVISAPSPPANTEIELHDIENGIQEEYHTPSVLPHDSDIIRSIPIVFNDCGDDVEGEFITCIRGKGFYWDKRLLIFIGISQVVAFLIYFFTLYWLEYNYRENLSVRDYRLQEYDKFKSEKSLRVAEEFDDKYRRLGEIRKVLYPILIPGIQLLIFLIVKLSGRKLVVPKYVEIQYHSGGEKKNNNEVVINNGCLQDQVKSWTISLDHETAKQLKRLNFHFSDDNDSVKWYIKFDEESEYIPLTNESPVYEMTRGRTSFLLRAEFGWRRMRYYRSHQMKFDFKLSKSDKCDDDEQVMFYDGDDKNEVLFPRIIVKKSQRLKMRHNWRSGDGVVKLPLRYHELLREAADTTITPDCEVLNILADYLESNVNGACKKLKCSNAELWTRMLQLIDYLQIDMNIDVFLKSCLVCNMRGKSERMKLINHVCLLTNEDSDISKRLAEIFIKD